MKNRIRQILCACVACLACTSAKAQNPFLPLWEFIPDGEPYVFDDPDRPGEKRVYVYGSHDSLIKEYCGLEQVVWSAPLSDLTQWRYDGVIFRSLNDRDGKPLHADGKGDLLYAPDVAVRTEADGSKTYYLYPNVQNGGRQGLVAKAKRPDGPFEVCNWSATNPQETDGILRFDPAVFVDDDGRVYGYWGFEKSYCAELDPNTMATVKPGTPIIEDVVSHYKQDGVFRFFEASSMRKIEDKYVFIYSRWTDEGEFGLPTTNYTLAYAYGDSPLGPFTYGGTIIDGRGRKTLNDGTTIVTATSGGNTHGSIFQDGKGQWWVVYHRQTGLDEYSRQAMAAPIQIKVQRGRGGKVTISEGEYTSEGFCLEGLNPLHRTPAGVACYYTGPEPARNVWPQFLYSGPYIEPTRLDMTQQQSSYNLRQVCCPVVNNTAGSVVGYKYFDTKQLRRAASVKQGRSLVLALHYIPQGVSGELRIFMGGPSEREGGVQIGQFILSATAPQITTETLIPLSGWERCKGKQPLYFVFESSTQGRSLCTLLDFMFL